MVPNSVRASLVTARALRSPAGVQRGVSCRAGGLCVLLRLPLGVGHINSNTCNSYCHRDLTGLRMKPVTLRQRPEFLVEYQERSYDTRNQEYSSRKVTKTAVNGFRANAFLGRSSFTRGGKPGL